MLPYKAPAGVDPDGEAVYPYAMAEDLVALSARFSRAMRDLRAAFLAGPPSPGPATPPSGWLSAAGATPLSWADRARLEAVPFRAALADAELAALAEGGERCAFWINVYNALASLSVVELGIRGRLESQANFPFRTVLVAGGFRWSLDDIEDGILRGNRPGRGWPWRPFGRRDGRAVLALRDPDLRARFALDRCTRSSPAFRAYSAAKIREELAAAEADFAAEAFRPVPAERTIVCSRLFAWWRRDFPGRWLDDLAYKGWKVRYLPYDGRVAAPRDPMR